jgi:CBS domain-containing protein
MTSQGTQQVRDVMTREVETIQPDASVQEAAQKMEATQHGPLPVVEGRRVVGIITDRDVVTRAVAAGGDQTATRVRDIMTTEVITVYEDQDAAEAAATLQAKQVSRAVVLNRNEELAGIVSLADLPLKRLGT